LVSRIQELTGCEFPLFAFRDCRDVVFAVSRARQLMNEYAETTAALAESMPGS
jgi:hypothetical protein